MAERDKIIHIRLTTDEFEEIQSLRDIYKFSSTAELIRYSIEYIDRTRPTLGRKFKPQTSDVDKKDGEL